MKTCTSFFTSLIIPFFAMTVSSLAAPTRIVTMGDSITAGFGTVDKTWYAYPAQLQRMLGSDWVVGNFGLDGTTLLNEGTLPYIKQDRFGHARDFKPDVVVIMLGTNDTLPQNWKLKSQFVEDYKDLIRQVREFTPQPRILICHPPSISRGEDGQNEQRLLEVIPLIDEVAAQTGVEVIDVHSAFNSRADLLDEGLHPNNAGAEIIAAKVYEGLTGKVWKGVVPEELLSKWNGFPRRDIFVNERTAILVSPEKALPGNPWIWRTEFFGAFPSVDIALVKAGYHVAYINIMNLYGAPVGVDAMDGFYTYLVEKEGLSPKPIVEGFSRGGLYALNWAARNPAKVGALYLDAPVCDFKSWPGGRGIGKGSPGNWENCLKAYGLSEQEALNYPLNPVDNLKPIADAKIPIIAVAGDADDVVPMEENISLVEKRYRELGGEIQLIVKPGVGHHPHSLSDPTPVVNFLVQHAE
jgi:lysophospholipase L1-like esterase/pimeloyl-ACP methyl ester carboxylesterase